MISSIVALALNVRLYRRSNFSEIVAASQLRMQQDNGEDDDDDDDGDDDDDRAMPEQNKTNRI